jgi:hypothetical protein
MIVHSNNKKIYQTVYQQKALTEYILGITSFSFPFVKAHYKAVCTRAIDFTLLDKVICGILQLDEVLNFEQIADILGLNVVHRPNDRRYIDHGEKEILEFALDSLAEFNMITTGDTYYSRCQLTELGKRYAAQGKKLLPAQEQDFELYFDLTDSDHTLAKKRFGKMDAHRSQIYDWEFDVEAESFVKEVAKTQLPEIYNPEQLCDFTDLEFIDVNRYEAEFDVVVLLSFEDNSLRFLAFDEQQKVQPFITKMIQANEGLKAKLLNHFDWDNYQLNEKNEVQKAYEEQARRTQTDIEQLIAQKKAKAAFQKSKTFYLQAQILDRAFLELHLEEIFDAESKEFWMFLSELNKHVFSKINAIICNKLAPQQCLFIVVPRDTSIEYQDALHEYNKSNPSVFVEITETIEQSFFLSKKGTQKQAWLQQTITTAVMQQGALKKAEKEVFVKQSAWNTDTTNMYKNAKAAIGKSYVENNKHAVETALLSLIKTPANISKATLAAIQIKSQQLDVFSHIKSIRPAIQQFNKETEQQLEQLQATHQDNVSKQLQQLKQQLKSANPALPLSKLKDLADKTTLLLHEVAPNNQGLHSDCQALLTVIQTQIKNQRQNYSKSHSQRRKKSHR